MNRLLFHEGGQPLHLDDLEFLQSSTHNTLQSIASALGDCILGGCTLRWQSDTELLVSAGHIAYKGHIYAVEGGVLREGFSRISNAPLYWVFAQSEGESKIFEDGSEHTTRSLYTARLIQTDIAPSGASVAVQLLPKLGSDFARRPHLTYSYEGAGQVAEFKELSRYSGILTLVFAPDDAIPLSGYFGQFQLSGVNNMVGRYTGNHPSLTNVSIEVLNGKITAKEERADGATRSHLRLASPIYISIFLSWDYEENNGAGSGISAGSGSSYRGVGRSGYGRS